MSSSFIVESKDNSKKDDTLVIVVNDDGTISVDHDTFQNIMMNQSNANVSVVRLGQGDADTENGDITLTVDPPAYVPPEAAASGTTPGSTDAGVAGLVDPFMEMDPEQLERLETALQSEEAKQILGENVTAMLDMLSVEEEQNSLKYSIQLDHCYTSRKSPSDPKPSDPLPIAESPDINEAAYSSSSLPNTTPASLSSPVVTGSPGAAASAKNKLVKPGRGACRPRRDGRVPPGSAPNTPKSTGNLLPRNMVNVLQQGVNKGALVPLIKPLNMNDVHTFAAPSEEGDGDAVPSSSSESSESEPPSDDDSDFGPRGPRRSGVRARGGRKGLTTRGGSLAATRRRGSNKQMDMEQVRRLDMEMAAAVDAMKSPDKEDKPGERLNPVKAKKNLKTLSAKKKEELPSSPVQIQAPEPAQPSTLEKPLITTNQVKANLINANTIKGDMILTKPGQMKNNQKVIFVQKQVMMKASELKNLGLKKPIVASKPNVVNTINSKVIVSKESKIQQPIAVKVLPQPMSPAQTKVVNQTIPVVTQTQQAQPQTLQQSQPQQPQQPHQQQQQPLQKLVVVPNAVPSAKVKTPEVKKEKKKLEITVEPTPKVEVEVVKPPEPKTPDANKKHQKREHRKSPSHLVDALGPALFSTPDIIRRVGSGNEPKTPELIATSPVKHCSMPSPVSGGIVAPISGTSAASMSPSVPSSVAISTATPIAETRITPLNTMDDEMDPHMRLQLQVESRTEPIDQDDQKIDSKAPLAEELQPSLDTASYAAPSTEVPASVEQHLVAGTIVSESSGIEGEEHLLATLEMEASKHEEELLAEALLLHEELGVDLADHPALVDQASTVGDVLLPAVPFVPLTETSTSIQHQALSPVTSIPSPAVLPTVPDSNKKTSRDEKEPVRIVRGGRIITLPPIEAPATRSKRLQAKVEPPQKKIEVPKKPEKTIKFAIPPQEIQSKDEIESEMDEDEEDGDNSSDSEDDPDRLWCICKRPHNNRFMISCDMCDDWFHGKCVHVSKAMGRQMEEKGIEWVCPNCLKKKSDDSNEASVGVSELSKTQSSTPELTAQLPHPPQGISSPVHTTASTIHSPAVINAGSLPVIPSTLLAGVTQCVVCKKEARNSSIYCSDACILTHAQESLTKDKPAAPVSQTKSKVPTQDAVKNKPDARVIVFERRSGKVLTGADAPTTSNLKVWLKENPTYEVVRPNNLNTLQIGGKTVTAIQTPGTGTGKITKTVQQVAAKGQGQPKMVYAKVAGSKQTVLAPSNKKIVIVTGGQSQLPSLSPSGKQQLAQSRQTLLTSTLKNPAIATKQSSSPRQLHQQKIQTIATTATPNKQTQIKKVEPKPSTSQQTKIQLKSPIAKRPETEPIRLNIRKTLAELLSSRIKETEDLKLTDEEITGLALNIELEMYKFFRDTGAKYKAKYRSLVFNIKDTKNLTLFRKIANKSLTPDAVVRLSPDEMASQELAEWREKETKHQLEMIKKNELDLMAQAKSIVVKTHKGEQIIENDGGIDHVDPKTPVQDIVTALNSGDSITSSTNEDEKNTTRDDKGKEKHESKKGGSQGSHSVSNKKKDKEKEKEKVKEKHDRSRSRSRRHHSRDSDSRSKTRERSRERERRATRKESKRDKDREREREKDKEREKEKEREKDREKEKQKDKDKDKHKKSRTASTRNRSRGRHRDYNSKENVKKEEDKKKDGIEVRKEPSPVLPDKPIPIEDRLWRHIEDETTTTNTLDGNESDVSDREPSSTVTIKTPDFNDELEKEREEEEQETEAPESAAKGAVLQTVWRGFVNMVDVAKFFITAQEVSGHARDLMEDLPDTVDVVGRISHETVWDYISKMKKTGSKEILVIRLTAANDEEKIPYITLYSYLNSRSRLGVVGNVSKNIKDFYIMPFSSQSVIPPVLLPLDGPGFEEHRPHLLLGIIVRNKRKRPLTMPAVIPLKITKKEVDRSFTPPLLAESTPKDAASLTPPLSPTRMLLHSKQIAVAGSGTASACLDSVLIKDKQNVTQMTLESLNKAHIGMSRAGIIESVKLSKIVPELSLKIGLNSPAHKPSQSSLDSMLLLDNDDDGDEPYSPGGMDDDEDVSVDNLTKSTLLIDAATMALSPTKNSTELQRKMDELNRQIEEQKQQIQNISSSFLGDATATLPGLGLDPPGINDSEEAYSPTDTRSFTPPPPGIPKISQPILDKVSNITIPANLQEILANVKRQESSKVDPYLPSKPSATFLTSVNAASYQKQDKYAINLYNKNSSSSSAIAAEKSIFETSQPPLKESKSTLRSLSDLDLIKKAEEELAAVAAAAAAAASSSAPLPATSPSTPSSRQPLMSSLPIIPPQVNQASHIPSSPGSFKLVPGADLTETVKGAVNSPVDAFKKSFSFDQPKPPGLEDEDFNLPFPVPTVFAADVQPKKVQTPKFIPKSGIVLSVKRKVGDETASTTASSSKTPRTKSRWGQGPTDQSQ